MIRSGTRLAAAVTTLLALTVVATGGTAVNAAAPSRTAVVGLETEPVCLNVLLAECNQFVSGTVATPVLAGAFRARPDFTFEPILVDRVDVQQQPFALTYHIKPEAAWSDGMPVSADDFLFTLETIRDPANNTLRDGYQNVTDAVKLDPKTVTVRFSAPNPDWQKLFQYVVPKHVLAGHDFDAVWRNGIVNPVTGGPIGSGPFLFAGWTRGQSISLARNSRWWGGTGPFLDAIEFAIVPSANARLDGIRAGTLDLIFPQAQFGIADLASEPGVSVEWAPGTAMEHLDFHLASASMPLLRERWFRQAVAHSIDRAAIAAKVYDTLVAGYPALHNLTLASAAPGYEPVFARYARDLPAVSGLMLGHGCVLGGDGIWVCGGVRASVKLATTLGNSRRDLVQQQLIAQAREAGIELVSDNSPASVLFGSRLGARDYESIMYAWVRLAGTPTVYDLYGCAGQQNFMAYCSPAVDALALAADAEVDPAERARLANEANRILAEDVPSLPLYMQISFLVRRDVLRGPLLNPGGYGTWNADTWRLGPDVTPPVTTASAAPAANVNGWNNGPVTVEFAATDDDTGVQEHRYTLTGAQSSGHWVAGGTSSVTVSAEGITRIEYFATDASGNVENVKSLTIRIDTTPPVVVAARSPAANERGWNNEDVTARFDATDALSGIDGETTASVVLAGEGADQSVERSFVDRAGNRASATVAGINIDKTAPTITCVAVPNLIWPPTNRLVPVQVAVGVTDGLSGSGGFVLTRVGSDEPGSGDIQEFVVGTPDTSGLVRAERSPRGDGRVYTLDYEGADRAGNTAACVARVEVPLRRP